MRWTSSSADICSFFRPLLFFAAFFPTGSEYSLSSTTTAWRSPSSSIAASASRAVVTPENVMPRGLSSERAAALRPLTNSFSTNGSSLMIRTRLTGFFMRWRARGKADCCGKPRRSARRGHTRRPREAGQTSLFGRRARRGHQTQGDRADGLQFPAEFRERQRAASQAGPRRETARRRDLRLSRHRFESRGEPALVPCRFVLVDDFLVGDSIHDPRGLAENLPRASLVAGGDRLGDALDGAGQRRAQARVVLAPLLALPGRLARALGIRHAEPRTKGRNCNRCGSAAQGFPSLKAIIPA